MQPSAAQNGISAVHFTLPSGLWLQESVDVQVALNRMIGKRQRACSIWMTWFNIRCFLLSSSLFQNAPQFGPVGSFFFELLPDFCFTFHFTCVLTISMKKKAKKKSRTLNNNLTSICFVFKDGVDHPWPLNCLSASLHWRPWKWSIVLLNLLKVLSAAYRPTLWWHRWGCGQNFNRVKWKPN